MGRLPLRTRTYHDASAISSVSLSYFHFGTSRSGVRRTLLLLEIEKMSALGKYIDMSQLTRSVAGSLRPAMTLETLELVPLRLRLVAEAKRWFIAGPKETR